LVVVGEKVFFSFSVSGGPKKRDGSARERRDEQTRTKKTHPAVGHLVAPLVRSHKATDLGQHIIPMLQSVPGRVAVADLCRTLLERRVDKAQVGVVLGFGVHAAANEVLHRDLDRTGVDAPREVQVGVEHVAVAVLLRSPLARPACPRRQGRACLVAHAVERVEHGHVGRQGFFGDHVTDDDHKVIVGQALGALAEVHHLEGERRGRGGGEGG
jgi:hypothetical protein